MIGSVQMGTWKWTTEAKEASRAAEEEARAAIAEDVAAAGFAVVVVVRWCKGGVGSAMCPMSSGVSRSRGGSCCRGEHTDAPMIQSD